VRLTFSLILFCNTLYSLFWRVECCFEILYSQPAAPQSSPTLENSEVVECPAAEESTTNGDAEQYQTDLREDSHRPIVEFYESCVDAVSSSGCVDTADTRCGSGNLILNERKHSRLLSALPNLRAILEDALKGMSNCVFSFAGLCLVRRLY